MAAVQVNIGPSGQPPVTSYTYDAGVVTLAARGSTVRSASELVSIVDNIRVFQRAVIVADPNAPVVTTSEPFLLRLQAEGDDLVCKFKAPAFDGVPPHLTVDATQSLVTRVTSFDAREQRSIAWGDFMLFVRWMEKLRFMATRAQS